MLAYLSGSIENSPDGGRAWRAALKPFLAETLRHEVYDPAEATPQLVGAETYESFRAWKTSDPDRFRATVRRIIAHDLEVLTSRASYVICNWDEHVVKGGGTQGELTVAFNRSIPIYLVTHLPLENISGWILGCAELILPNFSELRRFLQKKYGEPRLDLKEFSSK
ncbi:MAG: hypothetical protein LAO31_04270 [Acidobacteriia bacterium]|nr:hypothetical protein [Terriglobia bacterium]